MRKFFFFFYVLIIICLTSCANEAQNDFLDYKGESFSMQYPESWIPVDSSLSQDELSIICEKNNVEQDAIEEMLNSFIVFFIDPAYATEGVISTFGVRYQPGVSVDLNSEHSIDIMMNAYQTTFSKISDDFKFVEEPSVEEIEGKDYYICIVQINEETMIYQAGTNYNNSSYTFSYYKKSSGKNENIKEEFYRILNSINITS